MNLDFAIKRLIIRYRRWKKRIDNKLSNRNNELDPLEEKSIKLWKLCLKDRSTQLTYNSSGIRQLEKEKIFLIFKPSGSIHIMTIMDVTKDRKSVYEVHIPDGISKEICDFFDIEMEKRMRQAENNKKSIISDDIDRLIEQEEKELKGKK